MIRALSNARIKKLLCHTKKRLDLLPNRYFFHNARQRLAIHAPTAQFTTALPSIHGKAKLFNSRKALLCSYTMPLTNP